MNVKVFLATPTIHNNRQRTIFNNAVIFFSMFIFIVIPTNSHYNLIDIVFIEEPSCDAIRKRKLMIRQEDIKKIEERKKYSENESFWGQVGNVRRYGHQSLLLSKEAYTF